MSRRVSSNRFKQNKGYKEYTLPNTRYLASHAEQVKHQLQAINDFNRTLYAERCEAHQAILNMVSAFYGATHPLTESVRYYKPKKPTIYDVLEVDRRVNRYQREEAKRLEAIRKLDHQRELAREAARNRKDRAVALLTEAGYVQGVDFNRTNAPQKVKELLSTVKDMP